MLEADVKAAGIATETEAGILDFHALRNSFISHLVAARASAKTCQVLARHSTPTLTIGRYAKVSVDDVEGAVNALPDLTPKSPRSEAAALAATGTEGQPINKRRALSLPYTGDPEGRSGAHPGALTLTGEAPEAETGDAVEPLEIVGSGAMGRVG